MSAPIVIIGAGQAGQKAAEALRKFGVTTPIVMLGDETHPPYQRPPLSKRFLKGEVQADNLWLTSTAFFDQHDIDLRLGTHVARIDTSAHAIVLADDSTINYSQALIATGSSARKLPFAADPHIMTLRSIADVERIRERLAAATRIVIVGGGYIGLEVAAVLAALDRHVTIVEAQSRLLARVASPWISAHFEALHRGHGIDVRLSASVMSIASGKEGCDIVFADGSRLSADLVLASIGGHANDAIARASGIEVEDGILVDSAGRTSAEDIFAAGDCARFVSRRYGRSLRLESVQNANDHARAVAGTMAGHDVFYDPVPWFWSDQFDAKLQIVGMASAGSDLSVDGDPASGRLVVRHFDDSGGVVCVEAVNSPRDFMQARKVLEAVR